MKEKKAVIAAGIFLGVVFVGSFISLIIMYSKDETKAGTCAHIYQDGILLKTVSLEKEDVFVIKGENGAFNKIQVRDGSIAIIEASCPDFLCGSMGFISHGPIPITCLPNKLVIKIEDVKDNGEKPAIKEQLDGVVY